MRVELDSGSCVQSTAMESRENQLQPVRRLLSVVIPAYNEEDGIAEIVRRVMAAEASLKDVVI